MSSVTTSPLRSLPKVMVQAISEFLDLADSARYFRLNREYQSYLKESGFPQTALVISAKRINQLFAYIDCFRRLENLFIRGRDFPKRILPEKLHKIQHLTFYLDDNLQVFKSHISSERINQILAKMTQLKSLNFLHVGHQDNPQFDTSNRQEKSNQTLLDLQSLTELNLLNSHIDSHALLDLFRASHQFTSVNLSRQPLSQELLLELIKNQSLRNLDLSFTLGY